MCLLTSTDSLVWINVLPGQADCDTMQSVTVESLHGHMTSPHDESQGHHPQLKGNSALMTRSIQSLAFKKYRVSMQHLDSQCAKMFGHCFVKCTWLHHFKCDERTGDITLFYISFLIIRSTKFDWMPLSELNNIMKSCVKVLSETFNPFMHGVHWSGQMFGSHFERFML